MQLVLGSSKVGVGQVRMLGGQSRRFSEWLECSKHPVSPWYGRHSIKRGREGECMLVVREERGMSSRRD
jgi:hypothetical protein